MLSTAPDEATARQLARALVERGLVACVNVIPKLTSIYAWQGEVHEDAEVLLILKTSADAAARAEQALVELHPYDVPECVALAPEHVEPRYLAWLQEVTQPGERA